MAYGAAMREASNDGRTHRSAPPSHLDETFRIFLHALLASITRV